MFNEIQSHTHDGLNSQFINVYNVVPFYSMTAAVLASFITVHTSEGTCFNVYDSTNNKYYYYARLNNAWKKVELT